MGRRQAWVGRLLLGVVLLASVPAAGAETDRVVVSQGSLSVGKFYRFSRKPSAIWPDELPTEWSDGSNLTDERLGIEGTRVDSMKRFVGWPGEAPVEIVVDLGKPRHVSAVRLHLAAGRATNAAYPGRVAVFLRNVPDAEWRAYAETTDLPEAPEGVAARWFEVRGPARRGRFIRVRLEPRPGSPADKLLMDEIDVRGAIENVWRHAPATGCYHGAFAVDEGGNLAIGAFERQVGKGLAMVLWYQVLGRHPFSSTGSVYRDVVRAGGRERFMSIGWLPEISSRAIAEGALDGYLKEWFTAAAAPDAPAPAWIRPMNEMNSTWVKWGLDPESYRRAWRRMYNIAEQLGATERHLFVWAPNHKSYPDEFWNKMECYYPGDTYVDWVGISVYPPESKERDDPERYPRARIRECYRLYGERKPMMIAEGGFSKSVDRARWVREWFESVRDDYPAIKALIWENHRDRRIESDPEALRLYRERIAAPFWLAGPQRVR